MSAPAKTKTVRCAIYTRKSTEEGLAQEFNSLDAQRESAEAFIASQKHEGWMCMPDRYDDGGFTGGNMDRPALQRLMADAEAKRVDCIVVYKVDRLSRSLLDFARIMETLDRKKVSFVSVTQQFNTTHSMGRLTLNILLSFAQFEREIISERTRDKVHAARRKGKWTGGRPVLGYDIHPAGGKITVNETEARLVRNIFDLYLEKHSLKDTLREIHKRGWTTKHWTTRNGKDSGGKPFDIHTLHHLLSNVLYTGRIRTGKEINKGEQPPIVDDATFERVQQIMGRNKQTGGTHVHNKHNALLKGLIRCDACDAAMTHSYACKSGGRKYRYYLCISERKRGWHKCTSSTVAAGEIESFVTEQVKDATKDNEHFNSVWSAMTPEEQTRTMNLVVERVKYNAEKESVAITFRENGLQNLSDALNIKQKETR